MKSRNLDPVGYLGQCVQAVLEQNAAAWTVADCMDLSTKGYVCQRRQNFDEIGKLVFVILKIFFYFLNFSPPLAHPLLTFCLPVAHTWPTLGPPVAHT
jgi:hypothetical protein